MAILDAQQFRAVVVPTPRFLPQLCRQHARHQDFLGTGRVHFLTHDAFDLAQHAQAQRQPGVDARSELANHAGAHHQFMAHDLGIARGVTQGGNEDLAYAHGMLAAWLVEMKMTLGPAFSGLRRGPATAHHSWS